MNMRLIYIGPFSREVQIIFDGVKSEVVVYNVKLADPFETTTWEPKIVLAEDLVDTLSLRNQNKQDTGKRNVEMYAVLPILDTLENAIGICLEDETIEDDLAAFGLSAFRRSITKYQIFDFHAAYDRTFEKVTENSDALVDAGFTEDMMESLTSRHDKAWDWQHKKRDLADKINDTSVENQRILQACLQLDLKVLRVLRSYAKSIGDANLLKRATIKSVMSSVRPTPERKSRVREMKAGEEIIIKTNMNKKNVMQMVLLTDTVVKVGLTVMKTDELTTGTALTHNTMVSMMTKDMLGSGVYVKLRNMDMNKKARVRVFEVRVVG